MTARFEVSSYSNIKCFSDITYELRELLHIRAVYSEAHIETDVIVLAIRTVNASSLKCVKRTSVVFLIVRICDFNAIESLDAFLIAVGVEIVPLLYIEDNIHRREILDDS